MLSASKSENPAWLISTETAARRGRAPIRGTVGTLKCIASYDRVMQKKLTKF